MKHRSAFVVLVMALAAAPAARGGHELPVYPSYYPHEIEFTALSPEQAAQLLLAGRIQAYVGGVPRFAAPPPESIGSVESLGSFVIARINPSSPLAGDGQAACAALEAVVRALDGRSADFVLHPYPVTPFHGDYLHHVDLAEAAKARVLNGASTADAPDVKVKADGEVARNLVSPAWQAQDPEWDVEIAEVDAAGLVAGASYSTNGWLGPAMSRTGWFQASLLLGGMIGNDELSRAEADLERLRSADGGDAVERINLERSLVAALADSCRARVAGYTTKREYYSTVFTAGIENIAHDSIAGLNAPMFVRTVKLKDFPWNGWLALGIDGRPAAAWNPIAGFTDEFGRLMWSAVGDPGLIPSPGDSAWMLNRITDVRSSGRP